MADDNKPTTTVETPKAPEPPKADAATNSPKVEEKSDPKPVQAKGRGVGLHNR